tara:strand:+ start:812 stop:988 length:177 start_codon:yes stop_codon:yes gene_type:complete
MNRYQQQLCENLTVLLNEDYALLNDIIIEYVTMLGNTNRMHDLHEYTCKEIENDWGRG